MKNEWMMQILSNQGNHPLDILELLFFCLTDDEEWMDDADSVEFSCIGKTLLYAYLNDVRTILATYKVLTAKVH